MYSKVLYTLRPPQAGQCLQGISRDSQQIVVTCPLTSVLLLDVQNGRSTYQCITRHGDHILVYVLPPEADLSAIDLQYLHALSGAPARLRSGCPQPDCSAERKKDKPATNPNDPGQLRKLLWWLGFMSILLGSQSGLVERLWSLFLEVFKLLLQP